MRVYIPATFDMLVTLNEQGEHPIRSGVAFALTPALREFYTEGDDEDVAYMAFLEAARASIRLLATGEVQRFPARRVVISADVPDAAVSFSPVDGEAVVRIDPAVVQVKHIKAFHVDDADGEAITAKAIAVIDDADLGDEEAELIVGDAEDNLLSWYDAKELPFLVELL